MEIRKTRSPATEGDLEEFPCDASIISHTKQETEGANDVFEDDVLGELVSQPAARNEPSSTSLRRSQSQRMHEEAVNMNMQGCVLSWKNLSVKRGQKEDRGHLVQKC